MSGSDIVGGRRCFEGNRSSVPRHHSEWKTVWTFQDIFGLKSSFIYNNLLYLVTVMSNSTTCFSIISHSIQQHNSNKFTYIPLFHSSRLDDISSR
jgi:hypothetical protein